MNPVVGDRPTVGIPELSTARAAATVNVLFPIISVVPDDLVVVEHDVEVTATRVRGKSVLAIVRKAVEARDAVGPEKDPRPGIVDDGVVLNEPFSAGL